MSKVIRAVSMKLHPTASCTNGCTWSRPSSPETILDARSHAKATGHEVIVDKITRDLYRLEPRP